MTSALHRKFRSRDRALRILDQMKFFCARHMFGTLMMAEAKALSSDK